MPPEPHRIRLRGFWAPAPDGALERAFGRPRLQAEPVELWLVGGPFAADAVVSVNGAVLARLPAGEPLAARLPDDLPPRNRITVRTGGEWNEELMLEIRPAARDGVTPP